MVRVNSGINNPNYSSKGPTYKGKPLFNFDFSNFDFKAPVQPNVQAPYAPNALGGQQSVSDMVLNQMQKQAEQKAQQPRIPEIANPKAETIAPQKTNEPAQVSGQAQATPTLTRPSALTNDLIPKVEAKANEQTSAEVTEPAKPQETSKNKLVTDANAFEGEAQTKERLSEPAEAERNPQQPQDEITKKASLQTQQAKANEQPTETQQAQEEAAPLELFDENGTALEDMTPEELAGVSKQYAPPSTEDVQTVKEDTQYSAARKESSQTKEPAEYELRSSQMHVPDLDTAFDPNETFERAVNSETSPIFPEIPDVTREAWEGETFGMSEEERQKRIDYQVSYLKRGFFKTSGQKVYKDKEGNYHAELSPEVMEAYEKGMKFFSLKPSEGRFLWQAVSQIYGLTPDTQDRMYRKKDSADVAQHDEVFIKGVDSLISNTIKTGHPFGNPRKHSFGDVDHGGTRYTVPVMTDEMAKAFGNGRENNQCNLSPAELWKQGVDLWNQVKRNMQADDAPFEQQEVLRTVVDAIEDMNGTSYNWAGRLPGSYVSIREMMNPLYDSAKFTDDPVAQQKILNQVQESAEKYAAEVSRKGGKILTGANGEVFLKDAEQSGMEWALRMITSIGRSNGIVLDPLLFASSLGETALGSITSRLSGRIMRGFGIKPLTSVAKQVAHSQDVAKLVNEMGSMWASDRAGTVTFLKEGGHIGQEIPKGEGFKGKAESVVNAVGRFSGETATGQLFFKREQSYAFFNFLYINMAKVPGSNITPEAFEMMMTQDAQGMIEQAMQTPMGQDAMLQAIDVSIASANIFTEAWNKMMAKSAFGEFVFAATINKYMKYGINLTGKLIPFSHTATYCLTRGLSKVGDNKSQIEALTVGGRESFWKGLTQNLMIDAAWMGTRAGMLAVMVLTMSMLGVEPPDDDELKYDYGEWKIGGTPLKENWWLRDIFGVVMPAAVAIKVAEQEGLSNGVAWNVFKNGCWQTFSGNPFIELSEMTGLLTHFDKDFYDAQAKAEGQFDQDITMNQFLAYQATTWGLKTIASFFEPRIIRSIHNKNEDITDLAHSKSQVYTPDPNDDPSKTQQTSYYDYLIRNETYKSPMLAMLANIFRGATNQGYETTGYAKSDMPLIVISDPIQSSWYGALELDPKATDEERMEKVEDVMSLLQSGLTAQELAANGVVIPYEARKYTASYLQAMQNATWNDFYENKATPGYYSNNGYSYYENEARKSEDFNFAQEQVNRYKALNDMLYSDDIPYAPVKYNRWETDYVPRYTDQDGNRVDQWTALADRIWGKNQVTVEWVPYGDHKGTFNPMLEVDNPKNSYDAQTNSGWAKEGLTDWKLLEDLYSDRTIQGGIWDGENAYDLLSGKGNIPAGNGDYNQLPVLGQRAYIPTSETGTKLDRISNDDSLWTGNLGDSGKSNKSETSGTNGSSSSPRGYSSYSRSSGGGGGGGGRAPSIYSRPANSLNVNKPATMYAKIPTSARFDYLRPGFETKGSREAYKRQDI